MSSFSRCMSLCMFWIIWSSRFTSASCDPMSLFSLSFFSVRMEILALSSVFFSSFSSVSEEVDTSCVWSASHSRCSFVAASLTVTISFRSAEIVASRGPICSTSSCPSTSSSYLRFSRSTRYIFFSISSLRWRISSWYFSISLSLSLSSVSCFSIISLSCTLWASVLSVSTRMRLSSFSRCAASISLSCAALVMAAAAFM
mmetsp:Transcript_23503/g.48663  ORF Transcript_23503/g.48663 Transcript_23503/m.48663 type:complete len:200 (-) Transcript_23503:1470-2069(-)